MGRGVQQKFGSLSYQGVGKSRFLKRVKLNPVSCLDVEESHCPSNPALNGKIWTLNDNDVDVSCVEFLYVHFFV